MFVSPCSDEEIGNCCSEGPEEAVICVCQALTPVVRFCQIFGIAPIELHNSSDRNKNDRIRSAHYRHNLVPGTIATVKTRKKCGISSKWYALPSITNAILVFSCLSVTTWFFFKIPIILRVYFEGTDLYTFGTQTLCLYVQCNLILINSFIQRKKFCEIWDLLIHVLKELTRRTYIQREYVLTSQPSTLETLANLTMGVALPHYPVHNHNQSEAKAQTGQHATEDHLTGNPGNNKTGLRKRLKLIRICSYVSVLIVLVLSICHTISFIHLVFNACFEKLVDPGIGREISGKPPCPFSDFFLFLQKLLYGMIDFIQQGVAILFGILCLIVYTFFGEIEEQLEHVLKSGHDIKTSGVQRHCQVDRLRMIYEDLNRICRLMGQCFGLAVLAVMISSVVSITCALYSFTLYSGAFVKEHIRGLERFYVIWAFHGWFGLYCLVMTLIPSQMLTNAVRMKIFLNNIAYKFICKLNWFIF